MLDPFTPADEERRSYHSGLSGKVIAPDDAREFRVKGLTGIVDRTITFETGKYRPPFKVTIRTSADGWNQEHAGEFKDGQWRFTLTGPEFSGGFDMKLRLDEKFWMIGRDVRIDQAVQSRHFTDAEVLFAYQIRFTTNSWRPNHLITVRNNIDGWGRDIYGVFRGNTWEFLLDRAVYSAAFDAKFVLDRVHFMTGDGLHITALQTNYDFTDGEVVFSVSPTAYRHGYDNFLAVESPLEQRTVRSVGREDEEFDVIIVGSGMGGGTLADALSDRGVKVLILEAGGLWFPVHMNELPRSEVSFTGRDQLGHFHNRGEADFQPGVLFNLGGRSVYWSGLIPRMQAWEIRDVWPDSVRQYLTVPNADGLTGYDRAEKLMRKGKTLGPFQNAVRTHLSNELGADFKVIDLPRSFHQPNLADNGQTQNVLRRSTGGFSTADLLLDSLGFSGRAGRNNLRINLHHLATRIETSGDQAVAIVCQDLVGHVERRYRGRFLVLSCGSVESPKLALHSGLADPNGKIGIGLTDHPAYFYKIHHQLESTGHYGWIGDRHGHAKLLIRHRNATADLHPYNIELLINPKYWDTRHADDDLWDSRIENNEPSKVEIKFIFDSELNDANRIVARGEGEKPEVYVARNTWADYYKPELVEVRNQVLTLLGVGSLSTEWHDWEWDVGVNGSVHHAGGSLRMGSNGSGVVDENLRFLAYDNLYCCDVSVFPSIPAANPSLTVAALALRLANQLVDRLGNSRSPVRYSRLKS